jgi:hypothetical protein
MGTVAMHDIGSFFGQAALCRCLTENGQKGKREVRPTAPDIAPLRSETTRRQKGVEISSRLSPKLGALDCVGIIT